MNSRKDVSFQKIINMYARQTQTVITNFALVDGIITVVSGYVPKVETTIQTPFTECNLHQYY